MSGRSAAGAGGRFWIFWTATSVSALGSAVTTVALPLTAVLALQASPVQMGILSASSYVAWLLIGLPAGALVQRLPLRGVQVGVDLLRATVLSTVPLAWWLDVLTYPHLVVVALALSFAGVVYDVANSTFLPYVVAREELQSRNSFMGATFSTMQLGGPGLGGFLVGRLGPAPALLADVLSYVASASLLVRLPRVSTTGEEPRSGAPAVADLIRDGWRFVAGHPVIGPCMWAATAVNFVCGAQLALFVLYLVDTTGAPAELVGLLLASDAAGSLVGAALVTWCTRRLGTARVTAAAGALALVGAVVLPMGEGSAAWWWFFAGNVVFAMGVAAFSITTRTYRQLASPPDMLSRVMATVRFVSWGAIPLGSLVGGALASVVGMRAALWGTGAVIAIAPALVLATGLARDRDFRMV